MGLGEVQGRTEAAQPPLPGTPLAAVVPGVVAAVATGTVQQRQQPDLGEGQLQQGALAAMAAVWALALAVVEAWGREQEGPGVLVLHPHKSAGQGWWVAARVRVLQGHLQAVHA